MIRKIALLSIISTLTGCSMFTGLDSKSKFACAAPEGFSCTSMTGVYANLNNPKTKVTKKTSVYETKDNTDSQYIARSKLGTDSWGRPPMTLGENSGFSVRTEPQVMRVWVAPWESNDKTFYDQSFVYMVVDYGDWLLAHNKNNIIDQYAPIDLDTLPSGNISSTGKVVTVPNDGGDNILAPTTPTAQVVKDNLIQEQDIKSIIQPPNAIESKIEQKIIEQANKNKTEK